MFSLLYGFWELWTRSVEFNVLLLGLDNSGKTTSLERLKALHLDHRFSPDTVTTTIGLNIGRFEKSGVKLTIRDLGGMEDLRPIWEKYYPETSAVIFVYDAADSTRFEEAGAVVASLFETPLLTHIPFVLFANKWDLLVSGEPTAAAEEHTMSALSLSAAELARREVGFVAGSALTTGYGLSECVEWLLSTLKKRPVGGGTR